MPKSLPRYFFKVFFPDQSSNFLRIPPAFQEHVEGESGRTVSIKGPSGGIWKVDLVKNSDGFVFEHGWKGFVADQSLTTGDFLLFSYDGNSRFKVLLFDSTACEKDEAFLARPSKKDKAFVSRRRVEEENVVVEERNVSMEDEEDEENKPLVHFTKRRFEWILKKKRGIHDLLAADDPSKQKRRKHFEFKTDQSSSKKLHLSFAQLSPNSKDLVTVKQESELYSPSGSDEYSRGQPTLQNEDAMHGTPSFSIRCKKLHKLYNSGQVPGSSPSSSDTNKLCNALELVKPNETVYRRGSVYRVGSLISQRRPVTEEEVGRTLERAMSFKSEHPFAIAVMQDSYVYTSFFMSVPSWFAKEYLPKENTVLTVWDPSGKPWKITYISYGKNGALSAGWGKFSYANNLEKYDVCVLELIQKDHLKVHIYRVVEETTPLIRRRRDPRNELNIY